MYQDYNVKQCSSCCQIWPLTEYHKHKTSSDGLLSRCKGCKRVSDRAYYERNKERVLEKSRLYKAANKDWYTKYNREYNKKNKESVTRQKRLHYLDNREKFLQSMKLWRQRNKAVTRAHKQRYRALVHKAEGSIFAADIEEMFDSQQGVCAYCSESLRDDYHVDHVLPLSRGGSNLRDNIVLACPWCNRSKGAKTVEEFVG